MHSSENSQHGNRSSISPPKWVIAIGAGTGGPQALPQILSELPPDLPASILVVQRMRPGFTTVLAQKLNDICSLPVIEPDDGMALHSGRIYLTPSSSRISIESIPGSIISAYSIIVEDVSGLPDEFAARTDSMMQSVAQVFNRKSIGILLTGLGNDGRDGMRAIHSAGGVTIVQDEASSVVFDLPSSAIDAGVVQETVPLWNIANRIIYHVTGVSNAAAA